MRWCSSGMHDAPEAGGEWVEKKGRQATRRWQCRTCKENKKPPSRPDPRDFNGFKIRALNEPLEK